MKKCRWVASILSLTSLLVAGCVDPNIFAFVPARPDQNGRLLNLSADASDPTDPIDTQRPTIIITHGSNPYSVIGQWTLMQAYADAINGRFGDRFNILSWDWNAATLATPITVPNAENAVEQGRLLAQAALDVGVDPARTKLIAHSLGCVLAASTARAMFESGGSPLAVLTFLDAAEFQHAYIFPLADGAVTRIENFWAPAPGGMGSPVQLSNIHNVKFDGGFSAMLPPIDPSQSSHVLMVTWYLESINDPNSESGFNLIGLE